VSPIELAVAFGAGVISVTSPCCLPLLPGYLGYLTGLEAGELQANRRRTLAAAALFVSGFTSASRSAQVSGSNLGFPHWGRTDSNDFYIEDDVVRHATPVSIEPACDDRNLRCRICADDLDRYIRRS
jgi:hypothetical protein